MPDENKLNDQDYNGTVAIFRRLWQRIVQRYKKGSDTSVVVLGQDAIPLAIELSQFDHPITFVVDSAEGVKQAADDSERHGGKFRKFLYFDFMHNCPQGRIVLFIGLIEDLPLDDLYKYLDMLLRRSREIVCAVGNTRDWDGILRGRYDYWRKFVPDYDYHILQIKELCQTSGV